MLSLVAGSEAVESNAFDGKTSDSEFISNKESLTVGHSLARIERGIDVHADASLSVLSNGLSDLVPRSLGRLCSSGSPYLQTARRLKYCERLHFDRMHCSIAEHCGSLVQQTMLYEESIAWSRALTLCTGCSWEASCRNLS
jgi:hypothetical protein